MLEAGYVRLREVVVKRVTVVPFGVNDGCGNGTSCCGIEVRTDTTKLPNMIIARYGEGQNLFGKGKVFIKDKSTVVSRVGGVN